MKRQGQESIYPYRCGLTQRGLGLSAPQSPLRGNFLYIYLNLNFKLRYWRAALRGSVICYHHLYILKPYNLANAFNETYVTYIYNGIYAYK